MSIKHWLDNLSWTGIGKAVGMGALIAFMLAVLWFFGGIFWRLATEHPKGLWLFSWLPPLLLVIYLWRKHEESDSKTNHNLPDKENQYVHDLNSQANMEPELADQIIREYGYILEHESPMPGTIADIRKLPYPKEVIKQALIMGLYSDGDENIKGALKVAYIELANWQQGVGEKDQGFDASKVNLNKLDDGMIKQIGEKADDYLKWSLIVEAERIKLLEELKSIV